jgi:hypothetical protein
VNSGQAFQGNGQAAIEGPLGTTIVATVLPRIELNPDSTSEHCSRSSAVTKYLNETKRIPDVHESISKGKG